MILLLIPFCAGVAAGCSAVAVWRSQVHRAEIEATRVRWHEADADELVDGLRRRVDSRMLETGVAARVLSSKTGLSRRAARRMLKAA